MPGRSYYHLYIKMAKNLPSTALYLLPRKSANSLILGAQAFHYPTEIFEIKKLKYLEKSLTKEFHIRKPTQDNPCTQESEETYYRVE